MQRRHFFRTAGCTAAVGAVYATLAQFRPLAATGARSRIKIGQIGTTHAHASGKMATLRKLTDDYDVVGVVEPDRAAREAAQRHSAYRDLPWFSEEELLNIPELLQ